MRKSCHNNCNNRGNCISLRTAAATYDGWSLNHTTTYNLWDADLIYGCQCDPGWFGVDCSQKRCDYGVDPRHAASDHYFEKATFVCDCGITACAGKFKLRFLGEPAASYMTPSSTGSDLAASLKHIRGFYGTNTQGVFSPVNGSSSAICNSNAVTATELTFMRRVRYMNNSIFSIDSLYEGRRYACLELLSK